MAAGAGFFLGALSSCASLPVYETSLNDSKVVVPLSLFAKDNVQIVRPAGFDFDIGLKKEANGSYTALLLRCTHASNALTYTGNSYVCSLHGSAFDKEGNVTHGPAWAALKRLSTQITPDNIIILTN